MSRGNRYLPVPVVLAMALLASQAANAWPSCVDIFASTYPNSQTDDAFVPDDACQICHQSANGGGNFNGYGNDLLANGASGAGFSCTGVDFVAALRAVESLDSDNAQSLNLNIAEIEAGTQPGWCDTQTPGCSNSGGTAPSVPLDPAQPPPANNPPVADAGGPYSGEAGTTLIQFDGSGSSDPDSDTLTFEWEFGDGNTATGMMPTHTYAAAGNYEVRLVVDDGQARSDPSLTSAAISAPPVNLAPVANPGGPYAAEPGQTITFDGAASADPNGDPLTYSWDFGDGSTGSGVNPTHAYTAAANYTVTLTVNDTQLDSDPVTTTAEIAAAPANRAPTADPGGPYSASTGETIRFDGGASSDPDGDALTYSWDFGDRTTGTGATPEHSYVAAGVYEVSLVVSDGNLESAPAATRVEVVDLVAGQPDDAALYDTNCGFCHGDPWAGAAVEDALPGLRRVGGARSCNIAGSIYGTSVFPNGVPEMQFLQGLTEADIDAIAEYLNSRDASGEQRYVATCAGCHGDNGSGGRTDEDVHGDSADEIWEAIYDEEEMAYLACMPRSDIDSIAGFLASHDDDFDDDGIDDDDDADDDNDGIDDDADHDDDNDGRSDDEEREDGTDPRNDDTDGDGVNDGDEHEDGTNPRDTDTDDDDLDDGEEREHGTDPKNPDTDDDGKPDGEEVKVLGTNPLVADSTTPDDSSGGGGGTTGLPLLLTLLAVLRRRLQR
ncbi:MAG: PKD domain-containing protein [Gammaproteobacteria bacterium]|nr:PKD domain-containing protein [Gammaproteobacteria bacterium]